MIDDRCQHCEAFLSGDNVADDLDGYCATCSAKSGSDCVVCGDPVFSDDGADDGIRGWCGACVLHAPAYLVVGGNPGLTAYLAEHLIAVDVELYDTALALAETFQGTAGELVAAVKSATSP